MSIFAWIDDLLEGSSSPIRLEKADVEIKAKPPVGGKVQWDIEVKGRYKDGKKIKVPHGEGVEIHFDLDDDSGLGLRFDASAPFFVKEGTSDPCPSDFNSDQMMVDSCKDDKLVVFNWNAKAEQLRYQLNFVTKSGKRVNPFDPIIDNGGGGVKPLDSV